MRPFRLSILTALLAVVPSGGLMADYETVNTANALYRNARYDSAAALYAAVVRDGDGAGNSAVAAFNLGNTLFRTERFGAASGRFLEAAAEQRLPTLFRADAFFNAGNAVVRLALGESAPPRKSKLLADALKHYRSALLLNPRDHRSKVNYEITLRLLKGAASPPPKPEPRRRENATGGIGDDVATNILDRAAREEKETLRKKRTVSSGNGRPPSAKNW